MTKVTLKNKNVRFFDQPERVFKMDFIWIFNTGEVDMAGTTPEGVEVDNVFCKLGEFQAWGYDEPEPSLI